MRKPSAAAASAVFVAIAPGFVVGFVPWWISHWRFDSPLALRLPGALLTAAGILLLLHCVRRFVVQGLGTPAPVLPTRHLVVTGMYRYVRNPMYIAVVTAILGQAALFGSVELLAYGAMVWLLVHLFVLVYEEPALRRTFGAEYQEFCAKVPRWIPHLKSRP
ncbi:MAG TPA: isoprenylcysteine carboxylmethyltransferase family protein [Bryobacteraceae bacterium]|nr:isoprenylcysteine carboxylmethyltransferase family protein [Bryobacteraceae bacterium]